MKVFVTAYGGGHASLVLPVISELEARGHEVVFLAPTMAASQARSAGVAHSGYSDYLHLVDQAEASALGRPLAEQMHNTATGSPLEESVAYLGINMANCLLLLGEQDAHQLFERVGRQAFLPIAFMKAVLAFEKPDVVLTTNSPKTERATLIAANHLHIPCVRVEDVFVFPLLRKLLSCPVTKTLYDRTLGQHVARPSVVCVSTEMDSLELVQRSSELYLDVSSSRLVVTGQPALDAVRKIRDRATPHFFDAGDATTVVCWAHQNGSTDAQAVLSMVGRWADEIIRNDIFLVVKAHPNSSATELSTLRKRFAVGKNRRIVVDEMLGEEVIVNSHVVMAQASTMLLSALCIGKPIVVLDPDHLRDGEAFLSRGLALPARSAVEIDSAVRAQARGTTATAQAVRKRVTKLGLPVNGAERIAEQVEALG